MEGDVSWPWRMSDARPHGWFTANGITKFGPIPQRETAGVWADKNTWPPKNLEQSVTDEHERFDVLAEHYLKRTP